MTTLREAAQQALEAMEKATRFMSDKDYRKLNESIDVLKAALAEPVQEPVAVLLEYENGERELRFKNNGWDAKETPLYTAPPQRKPLTEEEIEQIADGIPVDDFIGPTTWHLKLSRAIEKAHGIGVEE